MNLHENLNLFVSFVKSASQLYRFADGIIEKDYYVTHLLKEITAACPDTIFIGGTSLSKCHKCIQRFSEDIDITVDNGKTRPTEGQIKRFNKGVLKCCLENTFGELLDPPLPGKPFSSGGRYHSFKIEYQTLFENSPVENNVRVEISLFSPAYPVVMSTASCYIADMLLQQGKKDIVEEYGIEPFAIKTQALERTFIDKVFAICDYQIKRETQRNSRHLYDLYQILPRIDTGESFRELIGEIRQIRNARNKGPDAKYTAPSAMPGQSVNDLLRKIIKEETFKSDYNRITRNLLMGDDLPSYKELITVLTRIIELDVF